MLKFHSVARKNPVTKEVKYYAQADESVPVTLAEITERVEKRSTVSSADAKAVLDALQFEIKEALLDGKSVRLGDLGSFHVTLASEGTDVPEELTADKIRIVRVRFTPSSRLRRWLDRSAGDVKFQKTGR